MGAMCGLHVQGMAGDNVTRWYCTRVALLHAGANTTQQQVQPEHSQKQSWTAGGWSVWEAPAIDAAALGCWQPSTQHRHAALCTWRKKILLCLGSAAKL